MSLAQCGLRDMVAKCRLRGFDHFQNGLRRRTVRGSVSMMSKALSAVCGTVADGIGLVVHVLCFFGIHGGVAKIDLGQRSSGSSFELQVAELPGNACPRTLRAERGMLLWSGVRIAV